MSELIRTTGELRIEAAAGDKPRRLTIQALSDGIVEPGGYGPVVWDFATLQIPATLPLLANHENILDAVIGQGTPKIENAHVMVRGALVPGPASDRVTTLMDSGVQLQASVGTSLGNMTNIRPGEKATVNGKELQAGPRGLTIVKNAALREVSILPVGADGSTYVIQAKGKTMPDTIVAPTIDADQIRRDERTRLTEIDRITAGLNLSGALGIELDRFRQQALNGEISVDTLRAGTMNLMRASLPKITTMQVGNSGGSVQLTANHLSAALMVKAGYHDAAEKFYGPEVMEQSRKMHQASLLDLCKASLQISGIDPPANKNDLIRASLATPTSLPTALGSSADKILEQTWRTSAATWRSWTAIRSASNFREQTSLRPSFAGDLAEVGAGGEIQHGSIAEETMLWTVKQYAKMYRITRQNIVNDDLSIFSELVPGLGKAAIRAVSDAVYTRLLANTGSFFASGNANLTTGGGGALSVTSLGTLVQKMRIQKDPDNNNLDITPAVLLVPPELEVTARGLLQSAELSRITSTDVLPTGNPWNALAKLEIEPRLSNSSFTGYSTTAWYLLGGPVDVPFIVGYLDGNEFPKTEIFGFDAEPNILAMAFRVIHDFGVAFGDYRAAQKANGA